MKTVSKFAFAAIAVGVLAGCSSNDEMMAQQKQTTEQIQTLTNELQTQKEMSAKNAEAVSQLQANNEAMQQKAEQMMKVYTVKENDTLMSISRDHDMSLEDLMALNSDIDKSKKLLIGTTVNIK
ncbi:MULTISPECIES: LysM peptidoglycan-binding domain-containing protein [Vibrio]|uniref:LysM peptidoglycan-binding domain-containing protein n=1 Tax=Vibrio algicola TaxID=2662262 RepID=A0A5Q0TC50_9VIBR|nr:MULTISPECIES: LysM domain-containing protein [Vibrio]MBD1577506.1 LysM peptidoglycan-binding domain-containing protein [Vibrio sp. S11_S32]